MATLTISFNVVLAACCTSVLLTIRVKRNVTAQQQSGPFDLILGHTFLSLFFFSVTTTVNIVLQAKSGIQAYNNKTTNSLNSTGNHENSYNITNITEATSMMFMQCALAFIATTSVQQAMAVFFPLKIKIWVTTTRTNLLGIGVYVGTFIQHVALFRFLEYKSLVYMTVLGCVFVPLTCITTLMYIVLCYKIFTRVCTRKTHGNSRKSGNFHDSKTMFLLLLMCSGALCSVLSMLFKQLSEYSENMLVAQYVQWVIAAVVFVVVNRSVLRKCCASNASLPRAMGTQLGHTNQRRTTNSTDM